MAERMRPVDKYAHAPRPQGLRHRLDRKHQGRRRGDVIDDGKPRIGCHCRLDACKAAVGIRGQGKIDDDWMRAGLAALVVHRPAHRVVDAVKKKDLVTGAQRHAPEDDAHRLGEIADKGDVIAARANELPKPCRRLAQAVTGIERRRRPPEEHIRLALHRLAPARLRVKHRLRAGPERAMVEEHPLRREMPEGPERASECDHACDQPPQAAAFSRAIQSSMRRSSTVSGTAPFSSTTLWNVLMSNRLPSAWRAFSRKATILSWPTL